MRGRMLAVAGTGAVIGMVLWGVFGVRSLAGPTAVFVVVFLGLLVLSTACEACRCCRRWRSKAACEAHTGQSLNRLRREGSASIRASM